MAPVTPSVLAPRSREIKRLEFHMSYICDSRCVFCSESVRMAKYARNPLTYREMVATVTRKRREGCEHITFVGGEPTLHPRFLDLLAAVKRLGYKTLLITNGTRLAEESFAARALPSLDEIVLSVHGDGPELHDALAQAPGSFERIVRALGHIGAAPRPPFLITNTVVTRRNVGSLRSIVDVLTRFKGVRQCLISNLAPDGSALEHYLEQAVRLDEIGSQAPALARLTESRGVLLRFFGMPLCALGTAWKLSNDLHWDPRTNVERATIEGRVGLEDTWNRTPQRMRAFPEPCDGCGAKGRCWGVFKVYAEHFGVGGLKALRTKGALGGAKLREPA